MDALQQEDSASESSGKKSKKSKQTPSSPSSVPRWASFWQDAVEESLFGEPVSFLRKHTGLRLFLLMLPRVQPAHYQFLFTKSVLRCIINNLSSPSRHLYSVAKEIVSGSTDWPPHTCLACTLCLANPHCA